jgi:transposase
MQTQVKEKLFAGQSIYVGIDYHKKSWKVTILGEHYEYKIMTCDPDAVGLSNYLHRTFPGASYHAVYESGFSGFSACRELNSLGINCIVVHAADVPTSHKDKIQKTDKADSRKLAKLLRGGEIGGIHIPEVLLERDRGLVRQRHKLIKDLSRVKNRVKSWLFQFNIAIPDCFTLPQSRHWSKGYLEWLKTLKDESEELDVVLGNFVRIGELLRKELLIVNAQLRALSKTERYVRDYELLIGIPGIGTLTAMTIITQLGDINRFKRLDELCNYIGLVPGMYGSGEKMVVGKLISRGRKELKIGLIEASWVAIRTDPFLMARFNDLMLRMPKNKAIIKIAKNLLNRIRYVLKYKKAYELGVVK